MNKHRFRLIFSKTLGFLIPVAEINNAQRKPGQTRGPSNAAQSSSTPFSATLKALPLALLSCFSYSTYAEVITEPGQRASMTQSSSGVPVLEINDPNNKGLSHNRFEEFNVNKPGLIFNNSLRDGTSQIGGFVVHNPNLTHEAKAILAEVSGTHPSTLSGILEVFGGKADVLIAKPKPDADGPGTSKPKPDVDAPSKPKPDVDTPTVSKPKPSVDVPTASKPVGDAPDGPTATKPAAVTETSNVTSNKPATDASNKPAADGGGKLKDSNARHMTEATTGKDLKNALAKLNSADRADQAALKNNPVTVEVRGPDGKIVPHIIRNAADLKGLHGMQVVTGEQAEGVNPGSGLGQASNLYIKVVEYPGGSFSYPFTSSQPKPMPSQMPKVN